MSRAFNHFKSNLVAYIALFVALGGTGYAATTLRANSVGNRQLKNHSVSAIKLDRNSIGGYVRYWARISADGKVIAARPRAHLVGWQTAPTAATWGGLVGWNWAIPAECFALATTQSNPPSNFSSYASADLQGAGGKPGRFTGAFVYMSAPETAVNVAVVCPQP